MFIPTILLLVLVLSFKESREFLFSLMRSVFEGFLYVVAHLVFYVFYALLAVFALGGAYLTGEKVHSSIPAGPQWLDVAFALAFAVLLVLVLFGKLSFQNRTNEKTVQ